MINRTDSTVHGSSAALRRRRRNATLALAGVAVFCAIARPAEAATTFYWDINGANAGAGGSTPSGIWSTAASNWSTDSGGSGVATQGWVNGNAAVFSAGSDATGAFTITISSGTNVTADSVQVNSGSILMGPGTLAFSGANTLNVASGATFNNSGLGSGFIAGTGGIVKNGGGAVFMGGSEAYSGTAGTAFLTINAGTIDFTGETALGTVPGAANANAVTINGGTLRYSGTTALTLAVARGVTIGASGGTIEVTSTASTGLSLPAAATFTLNGGATAVMNKTGPGRFTLNTTSDSYLGKYKILAGSISAPGDGRFGKIPASAVADYFVLDGGTLRNSLTTTVTINSNRGITLGANGGTLSQPTAGPLIYNGIIAGTQGGGLTAANNDGNGVFTGGVVQLGGANTYDGPTSIAASTTLRLGAAGVIPDTSVVNLLGSAAMFDLATNGFDETVKSISGTAGTVAIGAKTLTLNNPSGETYSSVITATAAGRLIKNGTSAITLAGSNTGFNGELVLNTGKIGVGASNSLGGGAGTVTINGGILSNTNTGGRTMPATVSVSLSSDFTVDDSLFNSSTPGQILFNGPATIRNSDRTITVNGTANLGLADLREDAPGRKLIKDGPGILALTGTNTANAFTGDVTVLAGKLQVNGTSMVGTGNNVINLSGGSLNTSANRTAALSNPINVTADSFVTTTSTAASVAFDLSSNTIGGTGGMLTFKNEGADGAGDLFDPRFTGSGFDFPRPIVIDNGAVGLTRFSSFNTTGTTQTFSGVISGTGGYRRSASSAGTGGITLFNATNTYSGGTAVNDGTLRIGTNNAVPSTNGVSIGGGTLDLQTFTNAIGTLSVTTGMITGGSGNLLSLGGDVTGTGASNVGTIDANVELGATRTFNLANTLKVSGVISGSSAGLTKSGTGILNLSGNNTYTGNTTISAGTLSLAATGTIANTPKIIVGTSAGSTAKFDVSAVGGGFTLASTQTLAGHGQVVGPVNVNGTIAPGNSVGELATGDQTWNAGGTYEWEIADATEGDDGNGVRWDHLTMTSLNITASAESPFTIKVIGTPTNLVPDDGTHTFTWKIAHVTTPGGINGFDVSKFLVDTSGFVGSPNLQITINQATDDLTLSYVPEPTSFSMVALAGMSMLRRRRR